MFAEVCVGVSRSDGSSAGTAQRVAFAEFWVGVSMSDGSSAGAAHKDFCGVNFGAEGEYTNAGAEGESTGVLGGAVCLRLLRFLRIYIRCINCFLVSQIEGVGGDGMSIAGVGGSGVGVDGVRAFRGVAARFALLACLRSLNRRRISWRLVSQGAEGGVTLIDGGGGGGSGVAVEVGE